ncbi:MAG: alkaline phosphatase [Halieaceae bacterium]|jgi:alkaline phosphatase|nr:alkaline phosphatase [Halieaceae bacterium]
MHPKSLFIPALVLTGGLISAATVAQTTQLNAGSSVADSTYAGPIPEHQRNSPWFREASSSVSSRGAGSGAKNVILFLGDGMGVSTVTAARILAGQQAGNPGEENRLSFETFPFTGLSKTYNVDSQTADSAGTMSAIMTGVKTDIGVFGIDENVVYGDCASGRGHELLSLLEIAELAGRATGIISTARITHATPGATYAKTADRDWEDDAQLSNAAKAEGCEDIASQFLSFEKSMNARFGAGASDGIEVALGGGRRHFHSDSETGGRRKDGRNLIDEWQQSYPGGTYAADAAALKAAKGTPVLGLFSDSHMAYAAERSGEDAAQPSLPEMTRTAIELLSKASDRGFFLMVEAGRIDHAHHAGNAFNALNDTIEMAEAVRVAQATTADSDTLILVTADHSHVFTMAGYPRRGNPILGKVVPARTDSDEPLLDENGQPYTTLGYMNGRGFRDYGDELNADRSYADPPMAGRQDLSEIDTTRPGYHQEALVPLGAETHGGEDVAVYATGPGAAAASGVQEQNRLFHVMLQATDWEREAAKRIAR